MLAHRSIRTVNTGVPETVPSSYRSGVAPRKHDKNATDMCITISEEIIITTNIISDNVKLIEKCMSILIVEKPAEKWKIGLH